MTGLCWTRHCANREQRRFLLKSLRAEGDLEVRIGQHFLTMSKLLCSQMELSDSFSFPGPTVFKMSTHPSCRKGDVDTQKPTLTPVKRSIRPAQQISFLSKMAFVLFCKTACVTLLLGDKHQMCFATALDLTLTSQQLRNCFSERVCLSS